MMLVIKKNGDPQAWAAVPAQKFKRMRANTPRGEVMVLRGEKVAWSLDSLGLGHLGNWAS